MCCYIYIRRLFILVVNVCNMCMDMSCCLCACTGGARDRARVEIQRTAEVSGWSSKEADGDAGESSRPHHVLLQDLCQ